MAKIINNPVTSTFSGGVGKDLVFRQVGNHTFVVKKPVRKKPVTPAEQTTRHLFAEAQIYAQVTLLDPELRQWYAIVAKVNNLQSAHRAAANDFLTKPEIERINTKGYQGHVGDVIHIKPKAALKITSIDVTIYNADGTVLESGHAIKNEFDFTYCATVLNTNVDGSKVVLVTHDRLEKSCRVVELLYV